MNLGRKKARGAWGGGSNLTNMGVLGGKAQSSQRRLHLVGRGAFVQNLKNKRKGRFVKRKKSVAREQGSDLDGGRGR